MGRVFALFPSFSNAICHERGVFAGIVTTVLLLDSSVPAEILPFVSVLTLSQMGLHQASIPESVSGGQGLYVLSSFSVFLLDEGLPQAEAISAR